MQQLIGNALRIGTLLACGVSLVGGVWLLLQSGTVEAPDFRVFLDTDIYSMWRMSTVPLRLTIVGLCLLILTPVVRVLLSFVLFAIERDRLYMVITLIVILTLTYQLL